jgi:hypothetical protein
VISRLGGLLLAAAGGYVAYYGWWETRVLAGAAAEDPIIDTAAAAQRWLANTLDRTGPAVIAAAVGLLLAAGLVAAWVARRTKRDNATTDS